MIQPLSHRSTTSYLMVIFGFLRFVIRGSFYFGGGAHCREKGGEGANNQGSPSVCQHISRFGHCFLMLLEDNFTAIASAN